MENQTKIDEIGLGQDIPQVEAKTVIIDNYEIKAVQIKEKEVGDKLVLKCQHPDMNEPIEISKVKYQFGDKLKVGGIWVSMDKDGKIAYKSALGTMMRYLKVDFIKDLKGKKVDTVTDENGYLVVKAY